MENSNRGFSLIELLVTIAISGIVLLMISFILVQGSNLFKNENENIDIQNELQIVRNQLSEVVMGAKSMTIVEAGEDIVIYTGVVKESNNQLDTDGTVTTERIITYDSSEHKLYISNNYDNAVAEGNLISEWVSDLSITINENCLRTEEKADGTEEQYYVNPLSVDITLKLTHGNESSDVTISVKVRNILDEVVAYKTDGIETLLINATDKRVYKVK